MMAQRICLLLFSAALLGLGGCSTNTLSPPSPEGVMDVSRLQDIRVGVLRNPHRKQWNVEIGGERRVTRQDENKLLAEYLKATGLFRDVVLVGTHQTTKVDYVVSCSVDCIYTKELDSFLYSCNFFTLGIGFLLGVPYYDTSACYVGEAVFYQPIAGQSKVIGGAVAYNYKSWVGENIYWSPDYYDQGNLQPLFRQILYEFTIRAAQ